MGEVNTPGYGVNNDTWGHSAAANFVTLLTPTMTSELYATITSFLGILAPGEREILLTVPDPGTGVEIILQQ